MNDLEVKKPNELIEMRGNFKESELKLSTYLISILKKDKYNYKISVKDYLEKFDISLKDFNKLHQTAKGLTKKQFEMVDRVNKKFEIYNFLSGVKYYDGILEIAFSSMLFDYLMQIKKHYLKYQIKNIMSLNSKYAIRLYEMLKNKFEKTKNFKKNIYLEIKINDLRKKLEIPKSYVWGGSSGIKKRILEKTKKELKEYTDIIFEYEEIKTGKKIIGLNFIISKNPTKTNEDSKALQEDKKEVPTPTPQVNNWNDWRKNLLQKGNLVILLKDEIFELKNNYLFKNNKLLSSEKSFEIWQGLYENRDRLKIMNEDDYLQEQIKEIKEQENKYIKLDELRKKYDDKTILGQLSKNKPITKYTIIAMQFGDDNKIELHLEKDYTKERSVTLFPDTNTLEDFLKNTYEIYLQNNKKIDKLNLKINKF